MIFNENNAIQRCGVCSREYCQLDLPGHLCAPAAMEEEDEHEEAAADDDDDADPSVAMVVDPAPPPPRPARKAVSRQMSLQRGPWGNSVHMPLYKIGVATWNLHGLNVADEREKISYDAELPARRDALRAELARLRSLARSDFQAELLFTSSISSRGRKRKVPGADEEELTPEEVAARVAQRIAEIRGETKLYAFLELDAPDPSRAAAILKRVDDFARLGFTIEAAAEAGALRSALRRLVGSENAWNKACKSAGLKGRAKAAELQHRASNPLLRLYAAMIKMDTSLRLHLVISHINALMAKNPWLDALILQEVRPKGLQVLQQQLAEGLTLTWGPLMCGVEKKLGQREYYPIVTRDETVAQVESLAVACRKANATRPQFPEKSKIAWAPWKEVEAEDIDAPVYEGPPNDERSIETINILWSKSANEYRPVVVHEVWLKDQGLVSIGSVHTSPGEGDHEWWREPEYEQLAGAFETCGRNGFWLMGGDYYLSAESRVRGLDGLREPLPKVGAALRKEVAADVAEAVKDGEPRPEFAAKLEEAAKSDSLLDKHVSGQDPSRNVLGLTFARTLPEQWWIAQPVSGSNSHLALHKLPAWATAPGKVPVNCIERARRFARAEYTASLRIADFFIYNREWEVDPEDDSERTLACRVGLLAPPERGAGSGVHWYDEDDLVISRYWLAISDHFPIGGVFTNDRAHSTLEQISAAPFQRAAAKPSPAHPDGFELLQVEQDGDCFFHALKAGMALAGRKIEDGVEQMRDHVVTIEGHAPKAYVGWPDWQAVAAHYGVKLIVHEYHYGPEDAFVQRLPPINDKAPTEVHLRFIHVPGESAGHMDVLVKRAAD